MISAKDSGDFSFTSFLCLGLTVVFRSSALREASRTVVFAGIILLLSFVFMKIRPQTNTLPQILVFEGLSLCLAIGLLEAFALIVPSDAISGSAIIGEVMFALIFVPLLADRTERHPDISLGRTVEVFLFFAFAILSISVIRELGAVGTIWGIEVTSGIVGKTPFLAHDSSAALIVAAIIIAMRLFLRRRGGDSLSFPGDRLGKMEVPYLDAQKEKERFGIALAALFATLVMGALVFITDYGLRHLGLPAILLPLFAVFFQTMVVGLGALSSGIHLSRFAETFRRPFLIPLQMAVVLLPIRFISENEAGMSQIRRNGVRYLTSIVLLWIFILGLISFIRTFKRKMLFGRRPKSVDGLPFVFILTALGMIVLSAFTEMIVSIL